MTTEHERTWKAYAPERFAELHEFKLFRTTPEGHADLWAAECWCGWVSDIYLTRKQAKSAHIRHFNEERERSIPKSNRAPNAPSP